MAYTIELSPRAFADIDAIVEYIQADSPQNATRWRRKLFEKIEALPTFPRGCSLAPEDEHCPFEVRQSIFGRYRDAKATHSRTLASVPLQTTRAVV